MNNEKWKKAILNIINVLENKINNKDELDKIYSQITKTITNEMELYLKFKECSKKCKQKFRQSKPYWSENLALLWKDMNEKAKKKLIKFKGHKVHKELLKNDFFLARKTFDKALKSAERNYNIQLLNNLETLQTNHPKEFWNKIRNLGPRKQNVPEKVEINNELFENSDIVLDKWASDFENLLNKKTNNPNFDENFYNMIIEQKQSREANINDLNNFFNHDFTIEEVAYHVNKSKTNKSAGFDNIPNEILKHNDVVQLLYKLFQFCFKNNMVPNDWGKAIITPIPKCSSKNPYLPLSYRGISLLPCISKIYTNILNSRITFYLENMNLLADEQNGFRCNRSCEDHVFFSYNNSAE